MIEDFDLFPREEPFDPFGVMLFKAADFSIRPFRGGGESKSVEFAPLPAPALPSKDAP